MELDLFGPSRVVVVLYVQADLDFELKVDVDFFCIQKIRHLLLASLKDPIHLQLAAQTRRGMVDWIGERE